MFTGTLTASAKSALTAFTGTIHAQRFDIKIELIARTKTSERAPDFDITATNRSGRTVIIGQGWQQTAQKTGNTYLSLKMDVGIGPFRVNAVQTEDQRKAKTGAFEIIPFVTQGVMKSGSMSGELIAMDADDAFSGYVANMMFDMDFIMVRNEYKVEETHPDYRMEVSSPKGVAIRVGSAWLSKSARTGNEYLNLLINTPDGELRVNAVQNDEQRGGNTFSIIPFIEADASGEDATSGLALVG